MKKNVCLIIFLFLTLSSCQDEESIHDGLYNAVCSYIYNRESDIYGFEEIGRYAQKTNKLSRDTDIYIIQDQIKDDVNSRLAVVAHTYFVKNAGINKFNRNNILEIEGKDNVAKLIFYFKMNKENSRKTCISRLFFVTL